MWLIYTLPELVWPMTAMHAAVQSCIHATKQHTTQCKISKEKPLTAMLRNFPRVSLPNSEILCLTRTPSLQNRLRTKEKQKEKRGGGREVEKRQGEIKNKSNKTRRRKERKQNSWPMSREKKQTWCHAERIGSLSRMWNKIVENFCVS